ncbi:hypothetical protein B566_EDAN012570, partial [Ephemera danica]
EVDYRDKKRVNNYKHEIAPQISVKPAPRNLVQFFRVIGKMAHWVAAKKGEVPDGAVVGGMDHASQLVVARAEHDGELLPGKFVVEFKQCYVTWDGKEHNKDKYEVLCNLNVDWVSVKGGETLPYNALPAGHTKDGEILYVGRAKYEHTKQLGKVQPSHGKCYIPYGGKELDFRHFEVMVLK